MDLIKHLRRQQEWSSKTFGPPGEGQSPLGVMDHIQKELDELKDNPKNLKEWIDIMILAFDGAFKGGHTPEAIVEALEAKQTRNEARQWPDWRTAPKDKAIEHVRVELEEREGKLCCTKCGKVYGHGHLSNCEFA